TMLLEDVLQPLQLSGAVLGDEDLQGLFAGVRGGVHGEGGPPFADRFTRKARGSASLSAGRMWVAASRAIASPGMPCTTEVSRSWAIVSAPALRMSLSSSAPSRPMPVSSTPMA